MSRIHERLVHASKGPVHVWLPQSGHDADQGVTVFVHGFDMQERRDPWYVDVVAEDFQLAKKLESSHSRAALVAIESQVGRDEHTPWEDLGELISFLRESGYELASRVHAIGHSGAYANIWHWLSHRGLEHITLLDASYSKFRSYADWVEAGEHSLDICVSKGSSRHRGARKILERLAGYYTWVNLPEPGDAHELSEVVYHVSRRSHMSWVTRDDVIPVFLDRAQFVRDEL